MSQQPPSRLPTFGDDCLPPEDEYESRSSLFKSINAWAEPRGYAFTTAKSTKERSGKQTITYACDRYSRPPSDALDRQRKTTTRGTGCPFSVLAKESLDKKIWTVRHRQDPRFAVHNHAPSQHPSAHPAHRRFTDEAATLLMNLTNAGIVPRDARSYLRQHSDCTATQKDIYNRIAMVRREMFAGQSSIHALANDLDEEGFWSRMRFDPNGRVTAVLFAHPDSLQFVQGYPDILLLDCTYKTNKYRMPLLDMIGVDACQRSFCIAFAFLSGEAEEDYSWALERLRSLYETCKARFPSVVLTDRCIACMNAVELIFPTARSLLCLWHANKAVVQRCKPAFSATDQAAAAEAALSSTSTSYQWNEFYQLWHSIVNSSSEQIFKERVSAFERKYAPDYVEQVAYIRTNWLDLYKERLVKAWVDQHSHFGNVATSRVEGIHALLKAHLRKSTLDLFEAWRAIKHALLNQLAELTSNQAKQQIRTPIELSGPLYNAVRGWISHEALRKVEEQRRLLDKKPPAHLLLCTETFTKSWGLPCSHTLKALLERDGVLLLEHFHSHWHLRRHGPPQHLLEPLRRIDSLKKTSQIPQQSTRREPSLFEAVEKTKASPTCSRCHQIGHSRTSNVCPLKHEELLGRLAIASGGVVDAVDEPAANVRGASSIAPLTSETSSHAAATETACLSDEADAGTGSSLTYNAAIEEVPPSPGDMPKALEKPQTPERLSLSEVPGTKAEVEQPPKLLVSRLTDIQMC